MYTTNNNLQIVGGDNVFGLLLLDYDLIRSKKEPTLFKN